MTQKTLQGSRVDSSTVNRGHTAGLNTADAVQMAGYDGNVDSRVTVGYYGRSTVGRRQMYVYVRRTADSHYYQL